MTSGPMPSPARISNVGLAMGKLLQNMLQAA
jgi:hypothetical protein